MKYIDGKKIANDLLFQLKNALLKVPGRKPGLAFVRVGSDPASKIYIEIKQKKCAEVGILSIAKELPEKASHEEVAATLSSLNSDPHVDGILLQLPLPKHLNALDLIQTILPSKDVDGFHAQNMGKVLLGQAGGFIPCTPKGIQTLIARSHIETQGKHVVIVGRSNIVGKPLAALLMQKGPYCNATVTLAHSYSKGLKSLCKEADILVAATGQPGLIQKDMIKPGATVIDVGIHRIEGRLIGDVNFEEVAPLTSHITPVPGGVGPMTVASLLQNTFEAYLQSNPT